MNKGTLYAIIFVLLAIVVVAIVAYNAWPVVLTLILMLIVAASGILKK